MVAKCADEASNQAAGDAVTKLLGMLRDQKFPMQGLRPSSDDLAQILKPTVAGDELRWSPDIVTVVKPMLVRSATQAARRHSAENMKQILLGIIMYANNHKGEFPPDLAITVKRPGHVAGRANRPTRSGAEARVYLRQAIDPVALHFQPTCQLSTSNSPVETTWALPTAMSNGSARGSKSRISSNSRVRRNECDCCRIRLGGRLARADAFGRAQPAGFQETLGASPQRPSRS